MEHLEFIISLWQKPRTALHLNCTKQTNSNNAVSSIFHAESTQCAYQEFWQRNKQLLIISHTLQAMLSKACSNVRAASHRQCVAIYIVVARGDLQTSNWGRQRVLQKSITTELTEPGITKRKSWLGLLKFETETSVFYETYRKTEQRYKRNCTPPPCMHIFDPSSSNKIVCVRTND